MLVERIKQQGHVIFYASEFSLWRQQWSALQQMCRGEAASFKDI